MEDIINHEVEEFSAFLLDEANKAEDGAIDTQNVYNISILNALWRIISGMEIQVWHNIPGLNLIKI
jgi:hypothetical protein